MRTDWGQPDHVLRTFTELLALKPNQVAISE
jgi:hypothetical protein